MRVRGWFRFFLLVTLLLNGCAVIGLIKPGYDYSSMDRTTKIVHKKAERFAQNCIRNKYPVEMTPYLKVEKVLVDRLARSIDIYFNGYFADIPFREENTRLVYSDMRRILGYRFRDYNFTIYARSTPIQELIPNFYRADSTQYDHTRMPVTDFRGLPPVRNLSRPYQPSQGLYNRNVALWHSHGWYYENKLQRWEWQRARVYQIVEDIFPMAFTVPYLIPMLENAGANVFLPRERDVQTHEVIVDNDVPPGSSGYVEQGAWKTLEDRPGFAVGQPPYSSGVNPFHQGSVRFIEADSAATTSIAWIPDIPETGEYAVTIAYASLDSNSVSDAHYSVYHCGGQTEFLVNQQMGGGTWIYLGTFRFKIGKNAETGKVVLTNQNSESGKYVTADALRFGGGMGNVSREGQVSGRPRFTEAARYYLQYAGLPDTLVWSLNEDGNDYKDDYQCRGEWVNYLKGAPFGPNKNTAEKGLGIPIDLSLAFHTDAGSREDDIVIGTLSIYDTEGSDSTFRFPDGMSRLANRDLADIVQTQIVEDLRDKYDPIWNRRMLWDKGYSEAFRPNVPSVLLELLSHHNFLDMKFGLDPRFRFDVSRSIYKAILRFINTQYGVPCVVQPLPVTHFQVEFDANRNAVLQWRDSVDSLEPSALADKYIVYTRLNDGGFDNGTPVDEARLMFTGLQPGEIYSFKVTAVNEGGESFPSEILAVSLGDTSRVPVMIVNGFDRVAPPATIDAGDYKGFMDIWDQGVPDRYDLSYVGSQYELSFSAPWLDDDSPGHGASFADYETQVIVGNSFDYPFMHGMSMKNLGYSFVSASDEAVMDGGVDLWKYRTVDLILGEERITPWPKPGPEEQFEAFPPSMQAKLREFCESGGNLFASGAYIASDPFVFAAEDSSAIRFVMNTLKYKWRSNHAVKHGGVHAVDGVFTDIIPNFEFNTALGTEIYAAEAPDAIEPADNSNAMTIMRYSETNSSAAVAFKGDYTVVVFGFPFETILSQRDRDRVMLGVFEYFR